VRSFFGGFAILLLDMTSLPLSLVVYFERFSQSSMFTVHAQHHHDVVVE
jgi:hypothetical protein